MATFATLRALQLVIADALDDVQRVFAQHDAPSSPPSQCSSPVYPSFSDPDPSPATSPFPATPPASFPPTPISASFPSTLRSPPPTHTSVPCVDYPSPDLPLVAMSPSEQLALHPDAVAAASRIVAACGQISNIVHKPFSSICDAIMSFNLPACMRLVEHLHVAEILREAEENRQRVLASGQNSEAAVPDLNVASSAPNPNTSTRITSNVGSRAHSVIEGLHVVDITNIICSYSGINYVDPSDLVHALRLLSTHHIFRETAPDTFALNRVACLLDSGKNVKDVFSNPETKYDDTGGIPALVASTTDEIFKSAAYLTEAFTGAQLPTPVPTLNASCGAGNILSGRTTLPSTSSFVINDAIPCPPTTCSSSVLTSIVYPEVETIRRPSQSNPAIESLQNDALYFPNDASIHSQPLTTEPPVSSSSLSLGDTQAQVEKEGLHSGGSAKLEKLPAFNLALRTDAPFFEWLENSGEDPLGGTGQGACARVLTRQGSVGLGNVQLTVANNISERVPRESFRLKRFSRAMVATTLWEAPRAILNGFDWYSLPKGSTIVDVGGGIGSTTMILARALNDPRAHSIRRRDGDHNEGLNPTPPAIPCHKSKVPSDPLLMICDELRNDSTAKDDMNLRFLVQDRPVVTALGIEAWRSKCPEMLESGRVVFQDHDFFEPQSPLEPPHPTRHPAVYILRVVLHDWPDECARRILINLRVASNLETRLVIAEHVLPLACVDEDVLDDVKPNGLEGNGAEQWTLNSILANVEGAESTLAPPPLLSNLGKASANAYWMDLLMHITFNAKERTLREFCALALSAGWRVARITRPEGTLFAYLVCEPIALPDDAQAIHNAVVLSSELSTVVAIPSDELAHGSRIELSRHKCLPARPVSLLPSPVLERSSSRCGTPTFGSRILLPKDEELQSSRARGPGAAKKWLKSKGLGVRGVMIQKVEKHREEQNLAKSATGRGEDDPQNARASSSHMRVWWKKSPSNSTSNSTIELSGEVPDPNTTVRGRRGTLKASDSPSTPSPRVSPAHQKWPSTESAALLGSESSSPAYRARRPSVASITRKLSFATFGRRPSIPDVTEPLPTPPRGAVLIELAPPPNLRGDTRPSLKHLPSLPTLGRSELVGGAGVGRPTPRRPSFSLASQAPSAPHVTKSALPRRPDIPDLPKSSILKSHTSSKQSPPYPTRSAASTSIPARQRRVTLSNSPATSSRTLALGPGSVGIPPDLAGPQVKRIPSVPKLPRRLSIPMLRRKQSRPIIRDGEDGD